MIVSVELLNGLIGYGECCPRKYVTGEDANTVKRDVVKLAELLKDSRFQNQDDIRQLIEKDLPDKVGASTICALESALLDAFCKNTQQSVVQALGIAWPEQVTYSGIVPLVPLSSLNALLEKFCRFNFEDIKLKIGKDLTDSLERIKLVKNFYGEDIHLRVDANCSWNMNDALMQIPVLCEAGIRVFEQIFLPQAEENWARVTVQFGQQTQLMLDESVTSLKSAERLIEKRIGNRFNLKISKQGGIFNTLKVSKLAKSHNIPCQLGAHYGETSILTTCGILFSAMDGQISAMEGAFGNHLLTADVCAKVLQFDQNASIKSPGSLMNQYGLGYDVVPSLLDKFTVLPNEPFNL